MGFQPGIAIFVGKEGQAVSEHFANLVGYIHKPLCHGIGLMHLADSEQPATRYLLASEIRSLDDRGPAHMPAPALDDFVTALTKLLARLRSDAEVTLYRPYLPLERRPLQIYVIGSSAKATRDLASHIRAAQADQVKISYLFCCSPQPSEQELFSESHEFASWAQANAIRFSYLYGDLTEAIQQDYRGEDFTYAAALALFALLTTDLSNHENLNEAVAHTGEDPKQTARRGTLSACMISSPHNAIRQAFAAKIGAFLLDDWQKDLHKASDDPELLDKMAAKMAKMPVAWLSPKIKELAEADKKKDQEITLEDLAPGPETEIILRTQEAQTTYKMLYATLARQTQRLRRVGASTRSFPFQRSPASSSNRQDAWKNTFLPLWEQLQQEHITNVMLRIEDMWKETGLSGTIALATRLDEELQPIIQRLQKFQANGEQNMALSQKRLGPLSPGKDEENSNGRDAPKTESPAAENGQQAGESDQQFSPRPNRLQLSLVCLIMGLLLSFAAWLLCGELGIAQNLLFVLLAASCFGGVFTASWLYLRRTFPLTTTRMRKQADRFSQREEMEQCLQESYQQRLNLALQLQKRVRCFTSAFLAQMVRNLAEQAEKSLEKPFLDHAGGRTFLCGNDRCFSTAHEASLDFLDHQSGRAKTIFNNLREIERESLSSACKDILHTFFSQSGSDSSEQALPEAFYYEIRYQIDQWFRVEQRENTNVLQGKQADRSITNYMSRKDFALDVSPELLERTLARAQFPTLWQRQGTSVAPTTFFCATQGRIKENHAKFLQPVTEIETTYAHEQGVPFELTSRWILLCALSR